MAAWARRPNDRVFINVQDLVAYTGDLASRSFVEDEIAEDLAVVTAGDSMVPGEDALYLTRHQKPPAKLNNLSFNQFCSKIGARAGEYRKLPAALAQIPLTYLAGRAARQDVKLLHTRHDQSTLIPGYGESSIECRAVTSPTYGRIWNSEIAEAVAEYIDPETWTVPKNSAFHVKTGFITASDRKCFIFMADENHPIKAPGQEKPAYRGFYVWNSEVMDGACGIAEFLYFQACANRCIVGLSEFEEVSIRHTAGAPTRWLREAAPKLKEYCNSSPDQVEGLLAKSTTVTVAKDGKGAHNWLKAKGFTKAVADQVLDYAKDSECGADPASSPYSHFNLAMGLTAMARNANHNDQRVDLERRAGAIMAAL
jgi:hypothetical protein